MTIFKSMDDGLTWSVLNNVDRGAVSYSALQILPNLNQGNSLVLLYERSNNIQIVFEPDEIVFYRIPLHLVNSEKENENKENKDKLTEGTCSCQQYGGGTCSGFCNGNTCPCMNCQIMTQNC